MARKPFVPSKSHLARQRDAAAFGIRQVGRPEPGFFKLRLVKGGPFVGARIEYGPTRDPLTGEPLDRSWHYAADINGFVDQNPRPEPNDDVWKVWEFGQRIDEAEYRFLIADREWAAKHAPELPEATPRKPVDLRQIPIPFLKPRGQ
jgi:hypothetical protein